MVRSMVAKDQGDLPPSRNGDYAHQRSLHRTTHQGQAAIRLYSIHEAVLLQPCLDVSSSLI